MINMQNPMVEEGTVIHVARKNNSSADILRRASDTRILSNNDLNLALKVEKRLSENKIVGYATFHLLPDTKGIKTCAVTNNLTHLFQLFTAMVQQWESLMRVNLKRTKMTFHSNTPMASRKLKPKDCLSSTVAMSSQRRQFRNGINLSSYMNTVAVNLLDLIISFSPPLNIKLESKFNPSHTK